MIANNLNMLYQNVRGLRTKTTQCRQNILAYNYDIICLTETWLTDGFYKGEICDNRYDLFRCDRSPSTSSKNIGGGVLICTKCDLKAQARPEWTCADVECIWVTVPARSLSNECRKNLHIASVYIPPDSQQSLRLISVTNQFVKILTSCPDDFFIIAGDFNLTNVEWTSMHPIFLKKADQLAYDRLYVSNIPPKLNEDGVENTFKSYGALKRSFLNKDPSRRYAMVTFTDSRDAERAIHGLHNKPPLNLNVQYAKNTDRPQRRDNDYGSGNQRSSRTGRDAKQPHNSMWSPAADDGRRQECTDRFSVTSSGRRSTGVGSGRQDWVANHSSSREEEEDYGEYFSSEESHGLDDLELLTENGEGLNPNPGVQQLLQELAEAKVQLVRSQMRERAARLGLNGAGGRKSLPAGLSQGCFMTSSGRIVRQVSALPNSGPRLPRRESNRQANIEDLVDDDGEQVPELREHVCVRCGRRGEMECGACGTTYCSPVCQRKDWAARHASVCHNLANSTANLARSVARVASQEPRQPRKSTAASPEVVETAVNKANQDGYRQQAPRRFANSNMHTNRQQRSDGGNKPRHSYNRRSDNNAKTWGGENQPHQNNADFYSSGKDKTDGISVESKLNPVPIRRPKETSVQNDWNNDRGRQLDSTKASETKPRTEKMMEPVKEIPQPVKKTEKADLLRPDGCVPLHASPGAILTLSVESDGATCDVDASYGQAVCIAVAEQFATQFEELCGDEFTKACEGSEICRPTPGAYVAIHDALDGAWYRARFLTETRAALVDAARIADVTSKDAGTVRHLPTDFLRTPEFCCVVGAGGAVGLKVGESYECVVGNVSSNGVCSGTLRSLAHADGEDLGPVTLRSWICKADDELQKADLAPLQAKTPAKPTQAPTKLTQVPTTTTQAKESTPEAKPKPAPAKETAPIPADLVDAILARPAVVNDSKVLLVEYADSGCVFVRRADQESKLEFDSLVQDIAVYGLDAAPLTELQPVGGVVVAEFTDGNYYRAIIRKRNRVEQSKYMLEYVEYGNTEISNLDKLRVCPEELSLETRPALLSRVSLADVASEEEGKAVKFSEECSVYLGELKDKEVELVLTLKDVSSKGLVGCEVLLCVDQNKERVNEKLRRMLMPQWEVMEAKGEDVVELPALMWSDMKIARLPKGLCRLQVLDASTLLAGAFSACTADDDWRRKIMELSEELEKYTSSKVGGASYLPRQNELCVFKSDDGLWYRAACVEHPGGAGASNITVLHVDSGRVESVAVGDVRKMLPATATRCPAMAAYCAIEGYPEEPSDELIARTRELLGLTDTSPIGGTVECNDANATSEGEYSVVLSAVMATLAAEALLRQ